MNEIDLVRPESNRITIGIPCFQNAPAETLDDYMRFTYYLGRKYPEWDFYLAIKSKTEQFRARNAIVRAALQVDSKYLLMLDDDHVIDYGAENIARFQPAPNYEFLRILIGHMENDEKLGAVGVIYYHRGGECRPVVMKEGQDGGFYWLRDDEITGGLQEVAVIGGGCMLLRCEALLKIPEPIFAPEFDLGTDIQVCKKLREAGYKVACDTSIEIGHVKSSREVITSSNRHKTWADHVARAGKSFSLQEGVNPDLWNSQAFALYRGDVAEYTGIGEHQLIDVAIQYNHKNYPKFQNYADPKDYYRNLGDDQIVRNCLYQLNPGKMEINEIILSLVNTNQPGYGLDFGCCTGYLGFELAMRGHHMDFVDLDGAPGYEFVKWRTQKRGLRNRVGFEIKGPYDYILLLDIVEHLKDWKTELLKMTTLLKQNGAIFCNFWVLHDYDNPEHINWERDEVKQFLIDQGIYPINQIMWLKYDLSQVGKRKDAA